MSPPAYADAAIIRRKFEGCFKLRDESKMNPAAREISQNPRLREIARIVNIALTLRCIVIRLVAKGRRKYRGNR
jgi:hypothetical protein